MESFIHADIFFFITSIAVIIITAIIVIVACYLIPTLKNFRDISRTLKRGVGKAEEGIEDAYDHVENSPIFRFIFGRSKKKNHK